MDYDGIERLAWQRATDAHISQRRKGGEPYIQHPKRVAELVRPHVSSAAVAAALLHDVLEDTKMTVDDFPLRIRQLVDILTKKEDESKAAMLQRIGESRDMEAQLIKLADRYDNLKDAEGVFGETWFKRYLIDSMKLLTVTHTDCGGHPLWLSLAEIVCASKATHDMLVDVVGMSQEADWKEPDEPSK